MPEQRNLDLNIRIKEETVEIDVLEPESGESQTFQYKLDDTGHEALNREIGNEIYSWISLWTDAKESDAEKEKVMRRRYTPRRSG